MVVKSRSNKKPLYVAILIVLVLLMSGLAYSYKNNLFFFQEDSSTTADGEINLNPPTPEDKREAERNKQRIIEEEEKKDTAAGPTNDAKQEVTPIIGFIQQADSQDIEANGYITSVIEDDGTCTLTLERQGQKVTKSKQALPDAQGTVCGLLTVERSRLSAGEWSATITYSSAKYQGTSNERKIKVN